MTEPDALAIYRKLTLIRQCQEAIIREYPSDLIRTPVHLGIGLEGISVGVAHALPSGTLHFGQLRNHGQYLALTGETDRFFLELYGKLGGTGDGKAGSMHLASPEHGLLSTSGIVASTIPLAVGAALAAKIQGTDRIACAMFGDAAVEEGEFWESLNFASLHRLRVLFVCEENDLAIHTAGRDRRGFPSILHAVAGFDCHAAGGDGANVRAVLGLVREAITKRPPPWFLCFRWLRVLEHVGPNTDWHVGYRPQPTERELEAADPVRKYERVLFKLGIAGWELDQIRREVAAQIEASIAKAKAAPYPSEADLLTGVYG